MRLPLIDQYAAYLRRGFISDRRYFSFGRREQAKFLLAGGLLVLLANEYVEYSCYRYLLIVVATLIGFGGTLFVLITQLCIADRFGDKRYNIFIRKRLSDEYRDDK